MHSRFELDRYARLWLPAQHLGSVVVLDSQGNRILRVGRYGNADSRGADSPVVDARTGLLRPRRADDPKDMKSPLADDIAFCWVKAVAANDQALFAQDYGAGRVLKVALSYAAEETVPVP